VKIVQGCADLVSFQKVWRESLGLLAPQTAIQPLRRAFAILTFAPVGISQRQTQHRVTILGKADYRVVADAK
jgi:hypothetical protein